MDSKASDNESTPTICETCGQGINQDEEKLVGSSQAKGREKKNIVTWDGPQDPENPKNFTPTRKWMIVCTTCLMTFCVTFSSSVFASAVFASAVFATAEEFNTSSEVMLLGVSLYVLGFALGKSHLGLPLQFVTLTCASRPTTLGSTVGSLRSHTSHVHRYGHLLHLSDTFSGCEESPNNLHMSFSPSCLRSCPSSYPGWHVRRYPGTNRAGCRHIHFCGCRFRQPSRWPHRRKLRYAITSWMEVDCMDHAHHEHRVYVIGMCYHS